MSGSINPLPHYAFMERCSVNNSIETTIRIKGGKVWTGIIWLRIGTSGGFL
jgi:hypothetical protein